MSLIPCFYIIKFMRTIRLLIMLTAFLIMVSSILTLYGNTSKMFPVYINIAAMVCLIVIVSILNFKSKPKDHI